jgi:hypothetical protein
MAVGITELKRELDFLKISWFLKNYIFIELIAIQFFRKIMKNTDTHKKNRKLNVRS